MKQQEMDLIHGPLSSNIWRMAIPLALTGLMQQFFNAADIAMVGRFVDAQSMAAVGSNAPLITTLLSLFIGLSIGTMWYSPDLSGRGGKIRSMTAYIPLWSWPSSAVSFWPA